jgi:hypothetical protein
VTRLSVGVALLSVAAAQACVEEGIVLCIDSLDAAPSDRVDVTVTMAAEDPRTGRVCAPVEAQVRGSDLPYCVAVAPGPRYGAAAYLRAEQSRADAVIARRELMAPFRDGEREDHEIVLVPSCADAPCGAAEQCLAVEGRAPACVAVPRPGVFDDAEQSDDVACDTDP